MTCVVYVLSIAPLMYTCFGFLIRYRYVKAGDRTISTFEKHFMTFSVSCHKGTAKDKEGFRVPEAVSLWHERVGVETS